jgi:DNA replication protein DnaC
MENPSPHAPAAPETRSPHEVDAQETRAPHRSDTHETRADIAALAAQLAARPAPEAHAQARHSHAPPRPRAGPGAAPEAEPEVGRCEQHGLYALNTVDADGTLRWYPPGCPACARERGAQALLRRAAIPPRFAHCDFDNYIAATPAQRTNLAACRHYAEHFAAHAARGTCMVLRGYPGTGKNHLATAITRHLLARGHGVLNATAHELVRRIRDTWRSVPGDFAASTASTETALLREFAALDLLIIDEAGRTYASRSAAEPIELFNLIDARYRLMKPTLVLSNLDRDSLREALGAAAYDRLREGGGQVLNFDWDSHRGTTPAPAPADPHARPPH